MAPLPLFVETLKRGDTWFCTHPMAYEAGGNTFDLTDPRFEVAGQLRIKESVDQVAAVFDFDEDQLAASVCLPSLAESNTALLTPGKTYYGDVEVLDTTGEYGRRSTGTFQIQVLWDVTRPGDPPAGLFTGAVEPTGDVDDGDFWFDTTVPSAPVVRQRIAGSWVELVAP